MKVLMINGSPDPKGCISTAFEEAQKIFDEAGVEWEEMKIGTKDIRGCMSCGRCRDLKHCVFDDDVCVAAEKLKEADGLIVGSPVYYSNPNGTVLSFMQRLFYSCNTDLHMKVGASVVSCRRGGNSATFESLNQFFGIAGMPIAPSSYWNDVHGNNHEQVLQDEEGLRTIRNLAHNMVFMMEAIKNQKETSGLPEKERGPFTNFIR